MGRRRVFELLIVFASFGMATAGCWTQAAHGPTRDAFNPYETRLTAANVGGLGVVWSRADTSTYGPSEAVALGGRAFVVNNGEIDTFATADGAPGWSRSNFALGAGPAAVGSRLVFDSFGGDCALSVVDRGTGVVVGGRHYAGMDFNGVSNNSSSCAASAVLAAGNRIAVGWQWLGQLGPESTSLVFPQCSPGPSWFIQTGVTVLEANDGLDFVSQLPTDGRAGCGVPPAPADRPAQYSAPTAHGDEIVTTRGTSLICVVSSVSCWSPVDVGASIVGSAISTASGNLAVATADGRVLVLDGTSHALLWTGNVGVTLTQPPVANTSTVFATAANGMLAAFDLSGCGGATCAPLWTATASPASVRPSIGGDVIYTGSASGAVTAFATAGCGHPTCTARASVSTGSEISAPPVIVDGRVIVGSANGTVTAFGLTS